MRSGCKVPTIRYYEDIGLLDPSPRTEGGHRVYGEEDAKRLTFIRRSRELGFSLDAIRSLLDLTIDRERSCAEVDTIATEHLEETLAKIRSLEAMRDALVDLLDQCRRTTIVECRVIDALSSAEV
jgi:DNA-binding transcriptional MerR regulator